MRPVSYYADPKPGTTYGSYVAAAHAVGLSASRDSIAPLDDFPEIA